MWTRCCAVNNGEPYMVVEYVAVEGKVRAWGYVERLDDALEVSDYLATVGRWAWVDGQQEPQLPPELLG